MTQKVNLMLRPHKEAWSGWSRIKKALRILTYAMLVSSLVLLLAVMVVPRLIGMEFGPVVSGSMEPTIKTGASIAIAKVDPARIQVGDIIGFSVPGLDNPICHRVIEVVSTTNGYSFRTKGDANKYPDNWVVSPNDVLGKVYFNTSFLLPVAKFTVTPLGLILLRVLPGLIVGGLAIKEIRQWSQGRKSRESTALASKIDSSSPIVTEQRIIEE
jgi:signal peptidase